MIQKVPPSQYLPEPMTKEEILDRIAYLKNARNTHHSLEGVILEEIERMKEKLKNLRG